MPVMLDGKPINGQDSSSDATVGQLVDSTRRRLQDSGTMIVAIRLNQQDVPPDQLDQLFAEPVAGQQDLELVTGRPKQVALQALEPIQACFSETFVAVKEAADHLAAGRPAEAKADKFRLAVQAFGSGEAYNQWVFATGLPEDIELKLLYAGEGTFWTDLKGFTDVMLGRQIQKERSDDKR